MTKTSIEERLADTGVVPLVQADDPETAIGISKALLAGGLPIIEVVLRTEDALNCLKAVSENLPDALVGAGTVLTRAQAEAAIAAGAAFIVSPGLDDGVAPARAARSRGRDGPAADSPRPS